MFNFAAAPPRGGSRVARATGVLLPSATPPLRPHPPYPPPRCSSLPPPGGSRVARATGVLLPSATTPSDPTPLTPLPAAARRPPPRGAATPQKMLKLKNIINLQTLKN